MHKCKIIYICSVCFLHKQLCSFLCKISGLEKFRNLELSNSSYTLFGLNLLRSVGSGGLGGLGPPQILIDHLNHIKIKRGRLCPLLWCDTCPHPTGFSVLHTALQPSNWHTFIQSVLSYKKTDNMQNQWLESQKSINFVLCTLSGINVAPGKCGKKNKCSPIYGL